MGDIPDGDLPWLNVLELNTWSTPASMYPVDQLADARLRHETWPAGQYRMYGAGGYDRFQLTQDLEMVTLQERRDGQWTTWMVDSPYEWFGIGDLAKRCHGITITAGLGLGLALHHLSVNPRVTDVIVVERQQAVIDLIAPLVRHLERLSIVHGDVQHFIEQRARDRLQIDSALIDIAAGNPTDRFVRWPLDHTYHLLRTFYPDAATGIFGADAYYRMLDASDRATTTSSDEGLGYCQSCDDIVHGVRRPWRREVPTTTWMCPHHARQTLVFESMMRKGQQ